MGAVIRSGAAAKPSVERIRMQRMSIKKLVVEDLGRDSKAERERRIVTPWRSKDGRELRSIIYGSRCLSKLFGAGLYEEELFVGVYDNKFTFIPLAAVGGSERPPYTAAAG